MAVKKKKKAVTRKKAVKKRPVKRKAAVKKKVVKRAAKRPVKRKPAAKKKAIVRKPKENILGVITHYFPHVRAAVIKLNAPLATGDTIKIKGHTTNFQQAITSMQIDHIPVTQAKKGQEIGLLVNSRVRQHDTVYKA
ncbi:MAG: hypothetical protein WC301_01580 [Candidatus Omnitrophota bacterium]|jgi:putative protease